MTVAELLTRMSSHEITEWAAEFKVRAIEESRHRAMSKSTGQPI